MVTPTNGEEHILFRYHFIFLFQYGGESGIRTHSIGHSDTSPYRRTFRAAMDNSMITIWWGSVKTGGELVTREATVLMSIHLALGSACERYCSRKKVLLR